MHMKITPKGILYLLPNMANLLFFWIKDYLKRKETNTGDKMPSKKN